MGRKKPKEATVADAKDQISAVDKTFYELTITDLNNKLAHLQSHRVKLEDRNEELETQMKQLEEDRVDVTAFLNRSLQTKVSNIKDLEEKLSELAKVRKEETAEFLKQIKEGELKFKTMQEELTSEIKLLTGKLNSLEEFRIQKDELLAKFDQQESELREQTKRHRDVMYEIERKQVVDKDRLKKDVENKLLELSNEFAKSNEIRISAHVQRLVRENIALNNELDRMLFSQRRIQNENNALRDHDVERENASKIIVDENNKLIRTIDNQLEIIKQMTESYERLKEQVVVTKEVERMQKVSEKREHDATRELREFKHKVHLLEQHVHAIGTECYAHQTLLKQQSSEIRRLLDILLKLKFTVKSATRGESEPHDDPKFRHVQRKHLLSKLMQILLSVNDSPTIVSSFETISSVNDIYKRGDVGITPTHSLFSILNIGRPISRLHRSRIEAEQQAAAIEAEEMERKSFKSYDSFPIIDLESTSSAMVYSDSSKGEAAPPENDQLEEDVADAGESSSEDGNAAPPSQPSAKPKEPEVKPEVKPEVIPKVDDTENSSETENILEDGEKKPQTIGPDHVKE